MMKIEVEVRDARQADRLREIVDRGLLGRALAYTKLSYALPEYLEEALRRESPRNMELVS